MGEVAVRALEELPTLPGVPYLGSFFDAKRDPLGLFERCSELGGDGTHLRFGPYHYLLVQTVEGVHRVLVENARAYHKSPNYRGLKLVLGNGLITSEGEFWKRQRKLAQPAFHRERLALLAGAMARDTADLLARWETEGEGVFDLHDAMMKLTLRIVGHTLFSTDVQDDGALGRAFTVALERANEEATTILHLPVWVPTPRNRRFREALAVLDGLVQRIIAERRRTPEGARPRDLLSMLLEARDDDGVGMSDAQLRDEVLSLVGAGHETTANALTWTFLLLAEHPDVARRVCEEARSALGERLPTMDDLPRLALARRVVEESMRLYPPVWVLERVAVEDDVVCGMRVPRGTLLGVSPWCLHRDPRYWPDPARFDPERFTPEAVASRPRYAYLPFGAGPRVCIGNNFAMMEAQLLLAMIARRHHFERAPWHRVTLEPSVTLRPRGGLPMVRRRRSEPAVATDPTATPRASLTLD
jgi:cytochrome P450